MSASEMKSEMPMTNGTATVIVGRRRALIANAGR